MSTAKLAFKNAEKDNLKESTCFSIKVNIFADVNLCPNKSKTSKHALLEFYLIKVSKKSFKVDNVQIIIILSNSKITVQPVIIKSSK